MADRGILFSAPMVRALLDGRKTQTRRLCAWANNPSTPDLTFIVAGDEPGWFGDEEGEVQFKAPHAPGDRLYVREHWKTSIGNDGVAPRNLDPIAPVLYLADGAARAGYPVGIAGSHRQAMHMPRWASRMWLTVTDVRVQRLQDMEGQHPLESDAIAEGVFAIHHGDGDYYYSAFRNEPAPNNWIDPTDAYAELWNTLHTEPGTRWADNPWVVATTFTVHPGNIEAEVQP